MMSTKIRSLDNPNVHRVLGAPLSSREMDVRPKIRRRIPSLPSAPAAKCPVATPLTSGKSFLTKQRLKGKQHQVPRQRTASSKSRQPSDDGNSNTSEQLDAERQDVRFIDVQETESQPSGCKGYEKAGKRILAEEILERSQESACDHVYQADIHASQITKIENLEKFTKLRVLDLSCNFIKRIENLQSNTDLRELKLYDNALEKIENLDQLKELQHLQLQHNKIKCIGKGLTNQRKLRMLRLDSNCLHSLEVRELAGCGQLTSLDISNNKLDNISAVSCLTSLEELIAMNNRLRSITDLSRCKKLHEIDVSYNKLTDLSGLRSLQQLMCLHASHNQLTGMRSLGKLRSLQELNVKCNRMADLKHIVDSYASLQILDVSENQVESWQQVETLKQLKELVELYISGNPFSAENGANPSYHSDLHQLLPALDILDGGHMKKSTVRTGTPLMRPMSASADITSRHVETQIKSLDEEMLAFEKSVTDQFESLRMTMEALPAEAPVSSEAVSQSDSGAATRPMSRSGKRSRIKLALEFAAQQYNGNPHLSEVDN